MKPKLHSEVAALTANFRVLPILYRLGLGTKALKTQTKPNKQTLYQLHSVLILCQQYLISNSATPGGGDFYNPHFMKEETEV